MNDRNKNTLLELVAQQIYVQHGVINEFDLLRDDLGFDSLDEIELVMSIENRFGVDIPDTMFDDFDDGKHLTVSDMMAVTDKALHIETACT